LFGYTAMVYATASIALLSFIVWAHHMFTVGMPLGAELFFMYATMVIAVPTGVKIFNWVSTMWRGSMTFETPMLFALAFVILFTIGGFSGLMLAIVPADFQYHDTYFVVAHFHYVLVTGAVFGIMAAVYYWLPKWTGNMYNERLGKIHFWWSVISVNVLFFPQHYLDHGPRPIRRSCCLRLSSGNVPVAASKPPRRCGKAPGDWNGRCHPRPRIIHLKSHRPLMTAWWRTVIRRIDDGSDRPVSIGYPPYGRHTRGDRDMYLPAVYRSRHFRLQGELKKNRQ
jgi:hypothetical protein